MAIQGLSAEGVGPDSFVTMKVSKELVDQFRQWSDPVEIKIVETPGRGTGWEMVARPALPEGFRLQSGRDGELFLDHFAADCNWDVEHDFESDWTLPELVKIARSHLERDHA